MNLTIDIGNTKTKVTIFSDNSIIDLKTFDNLQIDDVKLLVKTYPGINNCILSSVIETNKLLTEHLKKTFSFFIELNGNTILPFVNKYESKTTQGADRIAAIAGAQIIFPETYILIIDTGTAITFDFIDASGTYLGGNISPGLGTRFKSLHNFTQKLPLINKNANYKLLGSNTCQAIEAGVQNGIIFEINGYINVLQQKYPLMKTIITGGDAEFFADKLKRAIFVEVNLVSIGLNRILNYNACK